MAPLRKVLWAEGILLGPQHFQYWDNYLQNLQQLTFSHIHTDCWGIAKLQWEDTFLPQGEFRLQRCTALLADGRWVNFDSQFENELSITLPENSLQTIKIYLASPKNKYASGISGYPSAEHQPAWCGEYQVVQDEFDSGREREILLGRQNLYLITDEDELAGMSFIQVAELEYNAQQASYRMKRDFIPPVLKINASPGLSSWVAAWVSAMMQFLKLLKEQQEKHRHVHNQFGYGDFIYFNLIKTLSTYLPQLQMIQKAPFVPPLHLYQLCITLIGELRGFTDSPLDEPELPAFQLDHLSDVFKGLKNIFDQLIVRVTPANTLDIPLRRVSATEICSPLLDEKELQDKQFCLALYHDDMTEALSHRILTCIKVAAPSRLTRIVSSFIQGIKLTPLASLNKDLLAKRNYHYFALNKEGVEWEEVLKEGTIAFFISHDLAALPFELIRYD